MSCAGNPRPSTSSQPGLGCRSIGVSFSLIRSCKNPPASPLASVAPAGYAARTEVLHDGGDYVGIVACLVVGARLTPGAAIVLAKFVKFGYVVAHCRWLRSLVWVWVRVCGNRRPLWTEEGVCRLEGVCWLEGAGLECRSQASSWVIEE